MRTLGIDPGVSGAIGVIDGDGHFLAVHDMPTMAANKEGNKKMINAAELARILREIVRSEALRGDVQAVMERVSAMPSIPGPDGVRRGMGASSAFTFGRSVGHIEGVLAALEIPVEFVTPRQWKAAYGLGKDKEAARSLAQSAFPAAPLGLKKHAGRGEALLIAKWHAERHHPHVSGMPF